MVGHMTSAIYLDTIILSTTVMIDPSAFAQVALVAQALLITVFHIEARQKILMSSDWKGACQLRRVKYRTGISFCFLAAFLLGAVVQDIQKHELLGIVATWLVSVMIVAHAWRSEPLRFADLEALQWNVINEDRIRSLGNIREFTYDSNDRQSDIAKWAQQVKLACLEVVPIFPQPENRTGSLENVIQASKKAPLLLTSDIADYCWLALMLRQNAWKIVCACEVSRREFYVMLRCFPRKESDKRETMPTDGLHFYCKLMVLLEHGQYQNYYNDLQALKNQMEKTSNQEPYNTQVIKEWLQRDRLMKLRASHEPCCAEIEEMQDVCPTSCRYWTVLDKMAQIGYGEIPKECKTLEASYLLYSLSVEGNHTVNGMKMARNAFIDNCKCHIKQLVLELGEEETNQLFFSLHWPSIAEIAVLTFLRVGAGCGETAVAEMAV